MEPDEPKGEASVQALRWPVRFAGVAAICAVGLWTLGAVMSARGMLTTTAVSINVGAALLALCGWVVHSWRRSLGADTRCPRCSYPRASPTGRCTECGLSVREARRYGRVVLAGRYMSSVVGVSIVTLVLTGVVPSWREQFVSACPIRWLSLVWGPDDERIWVRGYERFSCNQLEIQDREFLCRHAHDIVQTASDNARLGSALWFLTFDPDEEAAAESVMALASRKVEYNDKLAERLCGAAIVRRQANAWIMRIVAAEELPCSMRRSMVQCVRRGIGFQMGDTQELRRRLEQSNTDCGRQLVADLDAP